jgi:ribosomal protein S18 acetylase RimI-like enzyme
LFPAIVAMKGFVPTMEGPVTIRSFDGSPADAEGLLGVERATFDESPYTAAEVQAMLVDGPQRAWVAVQEDRVAGFVIGFPVTGLSGSWWEVDLLAVHPDWRGRRLGHHLIKAATDFGAGIARKARAVVAEDNGASEQAFLRAGFGVAPGRRELLIFRPGETAPRPNAQWDGRVREATGPGEVADYLAGLPALAASAAAPPDPWNEEDGARKAGGRGFSLLLAEQAPGPGERAQPAGYAELIQVQTLLYRGMWMESFAASTPAAREALVEHAVSRTCKAGLDEIGALVHERDQLLKRALQSAGFRSLGGFRWLVNRLPEG